MVTVDLVARLRSIGRLARCCFNNPIAGLEPVRTRKHTRLHNNDAYQENEDFLITIKLKLRLISGKKGIEEKRGELLTY